MNFLITLKDYKFGHKDLGTTANALATEIPVQQMHNGRADLGKLDSSDIPYSTTLS